jgi:hypothetical protein
MRRRLIQTSVTPGSGDPGSNGKRNTDSTRIQKGVEADAYCTDRWGTWRRDGFLDACRGKQGVVHWPMVADGAPAARHLRP